MSMLASVSPRIAKPPGEKILCEATAHKKFCGNYLFLFTHWGIVWNYLRILNLTVFPKWKMSKMDSWVQISLFQESMVRRILMMSKKNKRHPRAIGHLVPRGRQECSPAFWASTSPSQWRRGEPSHSMQLDAVLRRRKNVWFA